MDDIYNGIPADCPLPDAPDVEQLQAEIEQLRQLLDQALKNHIKRSMGICPEDCWHWDAEKVLEQEVWR